MNRLLHSAKFWLVVLDAMIALTTLILQQVLAPARLEFALAVIGILQPVFIMIIKAIADEDVAAHNASAEVGWRKRLLERDKQDE